MKIRRLGPTCFRISFSGKNRTRVNVLIDPINGLKKSELQADIVLLTENKEKLDQIDQSAFLIEGPGEYEIKGVFVQGIRAGKNQKEKTTIYTISAKRMHACYLGDFGQKEFTEQQLEEIGPIDILILPIREGLTAREMQKIIGQVEPSIIIPIEPSAKALKGKLEEFLQKMGVKDIEQKNLIVLTPKDFKEEEMEIVVLKNV